jgi:hypothetical protein
MSKTQELLEAAWQSSDYKPDIFVVSFEQWEDYFDGLNPNIKRMYERQGFYCVYARKTRLTREQSRMHPYIRAVSFRGVPVVAALEYEALMFRKTTSRKVYHI